MRKQLTLSMLALAALQVLPTASMAQPQAPALIPAPATSTYYIATRPDLRKCAFPYCGGVFVKAVNQLLTRCANGQWQTECHAVTLDASAVGWDEETLAKFNDQYSQSHALVKGTLRTSLIQSIKAPVLAVTEGWLGQAQTKPTGVFYKLYNSGIVCITEPCPSLAQQRLNTRLSAQNITDIDLKSSGASEGQIEAAFQAIADDSILAAGVNRPYQGQAGRGLRFVASEFYLRVPEGKTPAQP